MWWFSLAVILIMVLPAGPSAADDWLLQISSGQPLNLPTSLTIDQGGQRVVDETVSWISRPTKQPLYWAARLTWEGDHGTWDLELFHHKLHHPDPEDPLGNFEVTHGFNLLTVARHFPWRGFDLRLGAGVVLPHTEFVLEGRQYSSPGYTIGGPVVLAGLGRAFPLSQLFFVTGEVFATAARADMTVEDLRIKVTSVACHLHAGVGVRF